METKRARCPKTESSDLRASLVMPQFGHELRRPGRASLPSRPPCPILQPFSAAQLLHPSGGVGRRKKAASGASTLAAEDTGRVEDLAFTPQVVHRPAEFGG